MSYLEDINEAWGWTGLKADEIVGSNEFGNFLLRDKGGSFWRICPEELTCLIVAQNSVEFSHLIDNEEFKLEWEMAKLVQFARRNLGSLRSGWAYYLVIPAIFGGKYDETNIRSVSLKELIGHAGSWAQQIEDLPDGAQIKLRVID